MAEVTQYDLSRNFWNYVFENPEKVKPAHVAIYFFAIEHYNRMGWKDKFGLPTSMVLDAIGMKSYSTYKTHFDDLVEWGFIDVLEYSKNQYSANIIALSKKAKANVKALDKALVKHASKHSESTHQSTRQSTSSIDKQETRNKKQETRNNSSVLPTAGGAASDAENVTEFWPKIVDVWFVFYEQKKGIKPTFEGAQQKSLKHLIENLKKRSLDKGTPWTEENAAATFTKFLEYSYNDNWIATNFLLTNLITKFDKIILNEKSTTSNRNQPNYDDHKAELLRKMGNNTGQG